MDSQAAPRAAAVKAAALAAGFDLVGLTPAVEPPRFAAFAAALAAGRHAGLAWLARPDSVARRRQPDLLLPGARTIVAVAWRYPAPAPASLPPLHGRVARYAAGPDYHDVLSQRLAPVVALLHSWGGETRVCVDSAPVLEVAHAARAGLGWIGKHSLLINQRHGSWLLLAEVLTTLELDFDEPVPDRCGSCTRCLEACPTQAIVAPYVVDAGRCLSYQTIEQKGAIAPELRDRTAGWVFGCDLCQEVCPWNQRATDPTTAPPTLDLSAVLALDDAAFRDRFRGTPVLRAKRRGLARNATVALTTGSGGAAAVAMLVAALRDPEPLVRAHAAWALSRVGTPEALAALRDAAARETDEAVREELVAALAGR